MASKLVSVAAVILGASLLGGCVGFKDHRGYMLDETLAQSIQVGIDNKESVTKTLGRPTFTGQFDANDWYYVSRDTKNIAFKSQKVLEQDVIHVRFDSAGNVAAVNQTDESLIANIKPVKDKTPTLGRNRSFFDEIFGNVGVFNQGALAQQPQGQ